MKGVLLIKKDVLDKYYIADGYTGEVINRRNGAKLGSIDAASGYVRVQLTRKILNKKAILKRSRMIWILINGTISNPDLVIDHINGNKSDDRIANLRLITQSANTLNTANKVKKSSKSGITGVYFCSHFGKWLGDITVKGKRKTKLFKQKSDAIDWRLKQEALLCP